MAPARRSCRRLVAERTRPPALCVGHCDRLWHVVAVVTAVLSGLESQPGAVAATVLRPHGRGQLSECRCCVHARLPSLTCSRTTRETTRQLVRSLNPIRYRTGAKLAAPAAAHARAERWHRNVIMPCVDVDLGFMAACRQVRYSPRTPWRRMVPSVIGRIDSWCAGSGAHWPSRARGHLRSRPPDRPRKAPLSCGRELAWASAGIVAYDAHAQ